MKRSGTRGLRTTRRRVPGFRPSACIRATVRLITPA